LSGQSRVSAATASQATPAANPLIADRAAELGRKRNADLGRLET
jgi:hypothetical protein